MKPTGTDRRPGRLNTTTQEVIMSKKKVTTTSITLGALMKKIVPHTRKRTSNSHHDIEVEAGGQRYRIADDYSLELTMTRVGGWTLWRKNHERGTPYQIGGEYDDDHPFRILVDGEVVFDGGGLADAEADSVDTGVSITCDVEGCVTSSNHCSGWLSVTVPQLKKTVLFCTTHVDEARALADAIGVRYRWDIEIPASKEAA
jgi:hypothetical protein